MKTILSALVFLIAVSGCGTQEVVSDAASEQAVPECQSHADCDDGVYCNGTESCVSGSCVVGAVPCSGGLSCIEDRQVCRLVECFGSSDCDDGVFCNGPETCSFGNCLAGAPPCPSTECIESQERCEESPSAPPEQPRPPPAEDDDSGSDEEAADLCPFDATKTQPGVCGCNVPDIDSDGDGFENCIDGCPQDPFANDAPCPDPPQGTGLLPGPTILNAILVADDGTFLGNVNDNSFDTNSLASRFGTYGSSFSSLSIWNSFGTYGSNFSALSPWSSFSSTPPRIIFSDGTFMYLTNSMFLQPSVTPNSLALTIGRTDVLR